MAVFWFDCNSIPYTAVAVFNISNSTVLIVIGMIVFSIVMGTHETVMRSAIADITRLVNVVPVMEYLIPVMVWLCWRSNIDGFALRYEYDRDYNCFHLYY